MKLPSKEQRVRFLHRFGVHHYTAGFRIAYDTGRLCGLCGHVKITEHREPLLTIGESRWCPKYNTSFKPEDWCYKVCSHSTNQVCGYVGGKTK